MERAYFWSNVDPDKLPAAVRRAAQGLCNLDSPLPFKYRVEVTIQHRRRLYKISKYLNRFTLNVVLDYTDPDRPVDILTEYIGGAPK
jgi:hypothetical protein